MGLIGWGGAFEYVSDISVLYVYVIDEGLRPQVMRQDCC